MTDSQDNHNEQSSTDERGNSSAINLDAMSLDQLEQLKQQEEGRLQALTNRYSQLKAAESRLQAANEAVSQMSVALQDKQVMVPLTGSLYVPATIRDANKLLVEVGTGFFVEKTPKESSQFLGRKLALVHANSENVSEVIQVTRQNLDSVSMAMRGKLLEIRARQEGMAAQQEGGK